MDFAQYPTNGVITARGEYVQAFSLEETLESQKKSNSLEVQSLETLNYLEYLENSFLSNDPFSKRPFFSQPEPV